MIPAFWDASALVPFCVQQKPSDSVSHLLKRHSIAVWWGTSTELCSAFERLLRMGQLTAEEYANAHRRLEELRHIWLEVQPEDTLRDRAEILLSRYPLRAADSLQLAAAWVWSSGSPQGHIFLTGDAKLSSAASQLGFQVISPE